MAKNYFFGNSEDKEKFWWSRLSALEKNKKLGKRKRDEEKRMSYCFKDFIEFDKYCLLEWTDNNFSGRLKRRMLERFLDLDCEGLFFFEFDANDKVSGFISVEDLSRSLSIDRWGAKKILKEISAYKNQKQVIKNKIKNLRVGIDDFCMRINKDEYLRNEMLKKFYKQKNRIDDLINEDRKTIDKMKFNLHGNLFDIRRRRIKSNIPRMKRKSTARLIKLLLLKQKKKK